MNFWSVFLKSFHLALHWGNKKKTKKKTVIILLEVAI